MELILIEFGKLLYLGSIPVTKYHHCLSTLSDLPVLFVNNYSEISEDLLNEYLIKNINTKFNFEKLDFFLLEKPNFIW